MHRSTRALKRLGVVCLTGATIAATPFIGFGVAHAAVASIQLVSPSLAVVSAKNDGTNNTVHLAALLTQATGTDTPVTAVRFSVKKLTPTTDADYNVVTQVGAPDTTAPYTAEWTPSASSSATPTYSVTAEGLNAANVVVSGALDTTTVTLDNTQPTAHFVSPTDGSIGFWNDGTAVTPGTIALSVTRSADQPGLSVRLGTAHAPTVNPTIPSTFTTPVATAPQNQVGTATLTAAQVASLTTTPNNALALVAGGVTDETIAGPFYSQVVTTVPAIASQTTGLTGGTTTSAPYVFQATDQNGKPVAGLKVQITEAGNTGGSSNTYSVNGGAPAALPQVGVTGPDGKVTVVATRTTAGVTTLNFSGDANANGVYNESGDFNRTASFTTYVANLTSAGPIVVTDNAVPTPNVITRRAFSNGEYSATFPVVKFAIADQNGTPVKSTDVSAKVVCTLQRTTTTGGVTTVGAVNNTACGSLTTDANGFLYFVHAAAPALPTTGQDVFGGFINNDGTPGYQAGGSDVLLAPVTLTFQAGTLFANNCLVDNCNVVGTKATNLPLTYTYSVGGTPQAGHTVTLSLANDATATGLFPTVQGAGCTFASSASVNCVSDAAGHFTAIVSSATTGFTTVTANDAAVLPANPNTIIQWRAATPALGTLGLSSRTTNTESGASSSAYSSPGRPGTYVYNVNDSVNGGLLPNTAITLTTDHGYFTPNPVGGNALSNLTYSTPPAAGAVVGTLKSLGSAVTAVSDNNGNVTFTLAIDRDPAFDINGVVVPTVTASLNGANSVAPSVRSFTTDYRSLSSFTDPINAGPTALSFVRASNDTTPAGNALRAGVTRTFYAVYRDSFGNIFTTRQVETASTSGVGLLNGGTAPVTIFGSYVGDGTTANLGTLNYPISLTNPVSFTSPANYGAVGTQTISSTYNYPTTKFVFDTSTPPALIGTATTLTPGTPATAMVNWYANNPGNYCFTYTTIPTDAGNGNPIAVGTTVSIKTVVTDGLGVAHAAGPCSIGNPVSGLTVTSYRAGPGQNLVPLTGSSRTDSSGAATYTFAGDHPGQAQVTTVITDNTTSNNELARSIQTIVFGGPATTLALRTFSNVATGGGNAVVTLKATVSPAAAGSNVVFYRRSGITGVVIAAGSSPVDSNGVATRVIHGRSGGIQLLYAVLVPNSGYPQVRSNDDTYKFSG